MKTSAIVLYLITLMDVNSPRPLIGNLRLCRYKIISMYRQSTKLMY